MDECQGCDNQNDLYVVDGLLGLCPSCLETFSQIKLDMGNVLGLNDLVALTRVRVEELRRAQSKPGG